MESCVTIVFCICICVCSCTGHHSTACTNRSALYTGQHCRHKSVCAVYWPALPAQIGLRCNSRSVLLHILVTSDLSRATRAPSAKFQIQNFTRNAGRLRNQLLAQWETTPSQKYKYANTSRTTPGRAMGSGCPQSVSHGAMFRFVSENAANPTVKLGLRKLPEHGERFGRLIQRQH